MAQAVKVTGYNLSLQQYSVGGAPIDAFKGRYRLIFRGTQSQNRIAALLAAYAEYAGIGVKTALGMGGVKIKINEPNHHFLKQLASLGDGKIFVKCALRYCIFIK